MSINLTYGLRIAANALVVGIATLALAPAEARVVSLEVVETESPAFDGRVFGEVGTYDRIVARATLAVDPEDPHNAGIVDISLAPTNAAGEVEFATEVHILRPTDTARGNARLFYDVLNRGRKLGLILLNDAPASNDLAGAEAAGNGFLMREGYTVVWSGWQPDIATADGVIGLEVPVLDGVTGMSREEAVFDESDNPATLQLSYPAAELDPARATLTVRQRERDERQFPDGLAFRYLGPTEIEITRPEGFDDGAIYEFIYPAADPTVNGLAFASTRDIVSYLRYAEQDEAGHANPLADIEVENALALGISQSGRFLRDFLHQGFHEDEAERMVFDGLIPHIAGSRKTFVNYRFSQPGRYSRQHEDHHYPGDQFPFTYAVTTDPVSGRTDGILAACEERGNCPKVIHTDTATEVWQGRAALVVQDGQGDPVALPDNVRAFLLAGAPHFNPADAKSAEAPTCRYQTNSLHVGPAMRALVVALDQWVSDGAEPPASRYPSDWLPASEAPDALTNVPGFAWIGAINELALSDPAAMPPQPGKTYRVPRPRADGIGHALDALRLPAVEVPVATYLGWNERKEGFAPGELCSLTGSMLPLAETSAEREASGDMRPSLEELYASPDDYLAKVQAAAEALVTERLMLEEDLALTVEQAKVARGIP